MRRTLTGGLAALLLTGGLAVGTGAAAAVVPLEPATSTSSPASNTADPAPTGSANSASASTAFEILGSGSTDSGSGCFRPPGFSYCVNPVLYLISMTMGNGSAQRQT